MALLLIANALQLVNSLTCFCLFQKFISIVLEYSGAPAPDDNDDDDANDATVATPPPSSSNAAPRQVLPPMSGKPKAHGGDDDDRFAKCENS